MRRVPAEKTLSLVGLSFIVLVEGLTGKIGTFLLAGLWLRYYYDMTVWFFGNLNHLRKIVYDPPVTCCARARF